MAETAWVYFDDHTAVTLADYRRGKAEGKKLAEPAFLDADGVWHEDVPEAKSVTKPKGDGE